MNLNKDQGQHPDTSARSSSENDSTNASGNGRVEPPSYANNNANSNALPPINLPPLKGVSGLGGWLVLVQIGIYGTLLMNLIQLLGYSLFLSDTWREPNSPSSFYYDPAWRPGLLFIFVFSFLMIAYITFILFAFYRKKQYLPKAMIIFMAVQAIFNIFIYIMLENFPFIEGTATEALSDVVRGILTAGIWIWYFLVSKRVRNTFIH